MQISVRLTFFAGITCLALTGTAAGDSNLNCDAYAAAAVTHQQQNRKLGCGYRSRAWSADYKGHRAWCLRANVKMADLTAEDGGRSGAIVICRAKSNACNTYATVAALQNQINGTNKCGFTGGRWSPDVARHRGWCMSVNPAKPTAETKLRASALQVCGGDAQLANVDLQKLKQKQQQSIQMLINISKMLHDTSMNVIRKIGG